MSRRKRSACRIAIAHPMLDTYPRTSLLGLPGELRNEIWNYVTEGSHESKALALLTTCRHFYHEICLAMFERTTFDLTRSGRYRGTNSRLHIQVRSTLNQMPTELKMRIKSLRAYACFLWLLPLLEKQCIKLDRLEIARDPDGDENTRWKCFNRFQLLMQDMLRYNVYVSNLVLAADSTVRLEPVHDAFVNQKPYLSSLCNYTVDSALTERIKGNESERFFVVRLPKPGHPERHVTILQQQSS